MTEEHGQELPIEVFEECTEYELSYHERVFEDNRNEGMTTPTG
jgi:hypothetical protein